MYDILEQQSTPGFYILFSAVQKDVCSKMEIHGFPTMLWGTADRFVAALEDSHEIPNLHVAVKENGKDLAVIVKDMEQFFEVPAVELLSSSFTGVHTHWCSPMTAHLT